MLDVVLDATAEPSAAFVSTIPIGLLTCENGARVVVENGSVMFQENTAHNAALTDQPEH